jgi:hypothetical protein
VKLEDTRMYNENCWKIGGMGDKGLGRVMEEVEQVKVKYTHSGHTLRHPFEHQFKY